MARQSKWYAIEANALHRIALADARSERHSMEAYRLVDRADSRKSKSWRSRDLALARQAERRADRAYRDRQAWQRIADNARRKIEEFERRKKRKGGGAPPKPKGKYEYILKVQYDSHARGRRSKRAHHAVWWDVRFRKRDGAPATKRELQDLVRAVRRGELPFEWERINIAWDRGVRSQLGLWDAEPTRTARSEKSADDALATLSSTLGREPGVDFVFEDDNGNVIVGEERRDG